MDFKLMLAIIKAPVLARRRVWDTWDEGREIGSQVLEGLGIDIGWVFLSAQNPKP